MLHRDEDDVVLLSVTQPQFRSEMQRFWKDGFPPLGVVGLRVGNGEPLTRGTLFPRLGAEWKSVFAELCRAFTKQAKEMAAHSSVKESESTVLMA